MMGALFRHFLILSLFAIGGANAVVPEMHRIVVDLEHWMTDRQFTDLFALANAAPGPNVLIVALVGFHVAGFGGAAAALLGMCGPSCALSYGVARVWGRFDESNVRKTVQRGLSAITIGLVLASGYILAATADRGIVSFGITAATALAMLTGKINPLWLLAGAGLLGFAGF